MSALGKFKSLFGEKAEAKAKPNHLKEVKADSSNNSQKNKDKAEVEILQKKIRQKIANDPKLQKKAAMILENMLNKNKK